MSRTRAIIAAVFVSSLFAGCASVELPLYNNLSALIQTGGTGIDFDAAAQKLNPAYRYLRLEAVGYPPAMLVLGYLEPHDAGVEEVWYSGSQEALRMRNGRLIRLTGALRDWRNVRFTPVPPPWQDVSPQGFAYQRQRDEMPGYRYGVTEQMHVQAWPGVPDIELPPSLTPEMAKGYRWFRETAQAQPGGAAKPLPDAWFAWGKHRGEDAIVYSFQCVAVDLCLNMQRWSVGQQP